MLDHFSEYKTVSTPFPDFLDREVKDLLQNGWQLYGTPYEVGSHYCQAMVR